MVPIIGISRKAPDSNAASIAVSDSDPKTSASDCVATERA
jgi:hypothetical protein